jgi:malonate transporter and related proteins
MPDRAPDMTSLFVALAPVFLVILVGWAARVSKVVPEAAWGGVNRFAYMILAPVYMFTEIARAPLNVADVTFAAVTVGGFLVMGALGFLLLPLARGDRPAFASAHQGTLRWNAFVTLAASGVLLGPDGSALVALIMGPTIPIVNIITVSVHARWGHGQNPTLPGILRSLAANPLIIACLSGLAFNMAGFSLSGPPADFAGIIGRGALGVTLMCVGAGLNLSSITARPTLMAASVSLRLIASPLIFLALGVAAGLGGIHLACLAIIGAAPSPPAAYILTREMGGDPRFMAGHITATTLLSAAVIPLVLALAHSLG